jgi:ribosomal protein S18 acetylase RimI-like enzyme
MKTKRTKIRNFQPSDAEACFRIRSEAFIKLFYSEIGPDGVTAGINGYLPAKYIEMAKSMPIFVAVNDEELVGFIASRLIDKTTMEILFFYIKIDYLRKGIGTKLLRYLEEWIIQNHPEIRRIFVDTAVPRCNQKFYEKAGYVKAGYSKCRYPDGSVAAVRLVKELNPSDLKKYII